MSGGMAEALGLFGQEVTHAYYSFDNTYDDTGDPEFTENTELLQAHIVPRSDSMTVTSAGTEVDLTTEIFVEETTTIADYNGAQDPEQKPSEIRTGMSTYTVHRIVNEKNGLYKLQCEG